MSCSVDSEDNVDRGGGKCGDIRPAVSAAVVVFL